MKDALRRDILACRRGLAEDRLVVLSRMVWERLRVLPIFARAAVVLFYASVEKEVSTTEMIPAALSKGKRVALPVPLSGGGLAAVQIADPDCDVTETLLGCPCPRLDSRFRLMPGQLDLAVVPGVGFDLAGRRLGRGGGHYDRFLASAPGLPAVGLAYEFQIRDVLPGEPHDRDVNWIVTEERVIDCSPSDECSTKPAAGGTTER